MTQSPAVLIVDDDPNLVRVLRAGLEAAGCRARSAGGAPEALACVLASAWDCLVIDQQLQHTDGLDALGVLQAASPPGTPVVFLTVRDDPDLRLRAHASGAAHVLVKPFDLSDLVAAVRKVTAPPGGGRSEQSLVPGAHVSFQSAAGSALVEGWVIDASGAEAAVQVKPGSITAASVDRPTQFTAATPEGVRVCTASVTAVDTGEGRVTLSDVTVLDTHQRRRHPRVRIGQPVTLTIGDTGGAVAGLAREVSLGGMSVSAATHAKAGARVSVAWSVPSDRRPLTSPLDGTVVRSQRFEGNGDLGVSVLAVRFGGLAAATRSHLRALVAGTSPV